LLTLDRSVASQDADTGQSTACGEAGELRAAIGEIGGSLEYLGPTGKAAAAQHSAHDQESG
jgi:hypothetical protein